MNERFLHDTTIIIKARIITRKRTVLRPWPSILSKVTRTYRIGTTFFYNIATGNG